MTEKYLPFDGLHEECGVFGIYGSSNEHQTPYDIYYGLMPQNPNDMPETEYLFIDSGGYETNDSFDLSERNKFNYKVMPWDKDKMKAIYRKVTDCSKFQNAVTILSINDTIGPFE